MEVGSRKRLEHVFEGLDKLTGNEFGGTKCACRIKTMDVFLSALTLSQ